MVFARSRFPDRWRSRLTALAVLARHSGALPPSAPAVVSAVGALTSVASLARDARADAEPAIALRVANTSGAPVASEPLRSALERELAVPVVAGGDPDASAKRATIDVTWQAEPTTAQVRFHGGDGRETVRVVELPADPSLATETLVFAISNLVRDEAASLLAALRPAPTGIDPQPPSSPRSPDAATSSALDPCALEPRTAVGADLLPYVGSSSFNPNQVRQLSFNLVAGYSRGLRGFELGAGANVETAGMCGVQIAAGGNVVSGPSRGLQLASFDISLGHMQGAQVGVAGLVDGDLSGFQLATVGIVTGSLSGLQLTTVNLAVGAATGLQLGTVNVVLDTVRGAQLGAFNLAAGDVGGVQLGVANIAGGQVRGAQLGVLNYADESDYPIGVMSVVRRGPTDLRAWGTESGILMAAVHHGGRVVRNTYGLGYAARDGVGAILLGIGAALPLAPRWRLGADVSETWLLGHESSRVLLSTLQASVDYALSPTFGLFAGPSFNVLVTEDKALKLDAPWKTFDVYEWERGVVRLWPGLAAGVRANL